LERYNDRMIRPVTALFALVAVGLYAFGESSIYEIETEKAIEFASPGGESLDLTLWQPIDDGQHLRPGIVLIHGGAWTMGNRGMVSWYGKNFARNGYVVVSIDYRLMDEYAFPTCIEDAKAAVRWMRANAGKYRIDPNRIAAMGESAGGHLTGLLATTEPSDGFEGDQNLGYSSEIQAAVVMYGPMDLTEWRRVKKEDPGFLKRKLLGYLDDFLGRNLKSGADPYAHASPITYADSQAAPMLLIHGTSDDLVDVIQPKKMVETLHEAGVAGRLVLVEGKNHGFDHWRPRHRARVFQEMLAFLEEHLLARSEPV